MKRYFVIVLQGLLFGCCRENQHHPLPVAECLSPTELSEEIVPASDIKSILDNYTSDELPGVTFMARKGGRYWQYNSGSYNVEKGLEMKGCLVWPGYSISKMYTATAILKLAEEGKITLDQKIRTYLPAGISAKVPGADKITVRMLLNHSSGIENFWQNPGFIAAYMENPARTYSLDDYLEAGRARLFEPGADIGYSNTNYLLLSVIIDHLSGEDHEKVFKKYIYAPLSLSGTFYKTLPVSRQNDTPRLYADVEGAGDLIDYTELSYVQFRNESGSNSIMATPRDFVDFIHGLTHGKLLNNTAFSEMKKEYAGSDSADLYGLGLEYFEKNGTKMYGHSGSSFGGRTLLLYNPETDTSFFVGVNAGAELGGPVLETIAGLMNALISRLAQ